MAFKLAFSANCRFLSKTCNRLHLDATEALMCYKRWLWDEYEGIFNIIINN